MRKIILLHFKEGEEEGGLIKFVSMHFVKSGGFLKKHMELLPMIWRIGFRRKFKNSWKLKFENCLELFIVWNFEVRNLTRLYIVNF